MSSERAYLWIAGVSFVAFGIAYLVAPVRMAALTELSVPTATAVIDIQGYFGGQLLGIGALVVLGAMRSRYAVAALLVIAASLGGTGLGRLVGLAAADGAPPLMVAVMSIELIFAGLALLLARRAADAPAA